MSVIPAGKLARQIADRVVADIGRDSGSLAIPPELADELATYTGYRTQFQVYPGPMHLHMDCQVISGGQLQLQLIQHGQYQLWSATLRKPHVCGTP